jgi:hypothetical protein
MAVVTKPAPGEFAPYFGLYIGMVPETDLEGFLSQQQIKFANELGLISEAQSAYRYAPGKWSLKQTLGHICDTERVFAYRLLRIARGDGTPLPGFEQNDYAATAASDAVSWVELTGEFFVVRAATVALLRHLPPDSWTRMGEAGGHPTSVRALAYMLAGHVEHHRELLRQHPPPAQ